ncbi:MAG: hypothetical protein WCJ59_00655 [bacterium]
MNEELNQKIEEMDKTLKVIEKSLKPTIGRMILEGMVRGVGYLFGLIIAIAIIGWLLNVMGVIPFLNTFSQDMKEILNTSVRNR